MAGGEAGSSDHRAIVISKMLPDYKELEEDSVGNFLPICRQGNGEKASTGEKIGTEIVIMQYEECVFPHEHKYITNFFIILL